jgi:hypothetical protein
MINKAGFLLMVIGLSILSTSAYTFEANERYVNQNNINVCKINLQNPSLGNINEGETKSYTKLTVPELNDAITITTTATNVYLHLDSDLDSLSSRYEIYTINVNYDTVPEGSLAIPGKTATTLTPINPDTPPIKLDVAGAWTFDFNITTKPHPVSSSTVTTVTIIVSAESKS